MKKFLLFLLLFISNLQGMELDFELENTLENSLSDLEIKQWAESGVEQDFKSQNTIDLTAVTDEPIDIQDIVNLLPKNSAEIDQHDLNPRLAPRVQLNEAEEKVIEAKGQELQSLREYYVKEKDKWWRYLGRDAIQSWIDSIDDISRFRDQIVKDFFIIKHGNTEEVKAALDRLKSAQKARSVSPNRSRYSLHGLLRNQYKIGFHKAIHRKDGDKFQHVPDERTRALRVEVAKEIKQAKETREEIRKLEKIKLKHAHEKAYFNSIIAAAIEQTQKNAMINGPVEINDYFKKWNHNLDPEFLKILNENNLFILPKMENSEIEFKTVFKNSLYHYIDTILRNHPFSDPKTLLISGIHFGTALVCNMFVPGSASVYYGGVTAGNLVLRLSTLENVENLTVQQAANFLAEEAANATWNFALNKVANKVSETLKKEPKVSESIQQSTQRAIEQTKKNIRSIETNQPGNIVISDKNKIPLITKLPHPEAAIPEGVSQLKHIFADRPGHMIDTPANRQRLLSIIDPKNYCGPDQRGNSCYEYILPSGQQLWVQVFENGIITNGGLNDIPRKYNPKTGFSALVKPTTNRKKE